MSFPVEVSIKIDILGSDSQTVVSQIEIGKVEYWPYIREGMTTEFDGDKYLVEDVRLSERVKQKGRKGFTEKITACTVSRLGGNLRMSDSEIKEYISRKSLLGWQVMNGGHNISPKLPYANAVAFMTVITKGSGFVVFSSDGDEIHIQARPANTYTEMIYNAMADALNVLKEKHARGEI